MTPTLEDALTVAGPAPKRIAKPDGAMMLVCVGIVLYWWNQRKDVVCLLIVSSSTTFDVIVLFGESNKCEIEGRDQQAGPSCMCIKKQCTECWLQQDSTTNNTEIVVSSSWCTPETLDHIKTCDMKLTLSLWQSKDMEDSKYYSSESHDV